MVGRDESSSVPLQPDSSDLSDAAHEGNVLTGVCWLGVGFPFDVATYAWLLFRGIGLPVKTASMAARRSVPVTGMPFPGRLSYI